MREEKIEIGSKWQHFKGDIMEVVMTALHTENLEEMIIYKHGDSMWARPISSFLSDEDISGRSDNKTGQKYRFEKVGE
ncbi:MAG: DUF1653 domain-containing protein [Bacilli bacterium]|nr:DUF1653 domain-containing protein [Bacilli bacterium]